MTEHHISHNDLLEYVTGSLPEPVSLLTATHLTLCGACRDTVDLLESVGGALLETISDGEPDTPDDASRVVAAMLETLETIQQTDASDSDQIQEIEAGVGAIAHTNAMDIEDFPRVLQRYIVKHFDSSKWKRLIAGVESWQLVKDDNDIVASLMRVEAGRVMPSHTHEGREMTLILSGSMRDRDVVYRRGDVVEADRTIRHQPQAGSDEACTCLTVVEGQVLLINPVYRLVSRVLGVNQ